jgi:molybdopterin molybdotransferase
LPEFLHLLPPSQALSTFIEALPKDRHADVEQVETLASIRRVLAKPLRAPIPLPSFTRTTVDGYAVRAVDTFGASPTLPAYLELIGEVAMGTLAGMPVNSGEAVLIHTGGSLPENTDAVVMIEDTQRTLENQIEILKPAAPGENIIQRGEDVQKGDLVLEVGRELRPFEIGGLMALGFVEVPVQRQPRVGILSTGDEIIPPEDVPDPGQVRDINSYALSALILQAGGIPIRRGIIPDDFDALLASARESFDEDDFVIITAGSSVSTHDMTSQVIQSLGQPGVLVHGIAIKPGKPTILAVADGVPLVGLPGNPVSALVVAKLFVVPVIRKMLGAIENVPVAHIRAKLSTNLNSEAGRDDYIPVKLFRDKQGWIAEPVFGRSNLIFTLVRSGGLLHIPSEVTGLAAGMEVEVELL